MLHKTRGIVLNHIKYRESSIIVKIYTENFGLISYIVNGVRSAKGKSKIAYFQPLTLLELVVYENKKSSLQRISEMKCPDPLVEIPTNIKKTSIAIFVTEVLTKCLHDHEENPPLFAFLYQAILILEHLQSGYNNFHLQFMLKLSRYLGFEPMSGASLYEELVAAGFKTNYLTDTEKLVDDLIKNPLENSLSVPRESRSQILNDLVNFYQIHVAGIGKFRSIEVLSEVLS